MKIFKHPEFPCVYSDHEYISKELDRGISGLKLMFQSKHVFNDNHIKTLHNIINNLEKIIKNQDLTLTWEVGQKKFYFLSDKRDIGFAVDVCDESGKISDDLYLNCIHCINVVSQTEVFIKEEQDKVYEPVLKKRYDNITGELFVSFIEQLYIHQLTDKMHKDALKLKREAKNAAKSLVKYRYKIGEWYSIRYRQLNHTETNKDIYEVKKVIHSIGSTIVNVLIMKKVSNGNSMQDVGRNILTHHDCKLFHIKYEPGLMVFNMSEKLYKVSKEKENAKIEFNKTT